MNGLFTASATRSSTPSSSLSLSLSSLLRLWIGVRSSERDVRCRPVDLRRSAEGSGGSKFAIAKYRRVVWGSRHAHRSVREAIGRFADGEHAVGVPSEHQSDGKLAPLSLLRRRSEVELLHFLSSRFCTELNPSSR